MRPEASRDSAACAYRIGPIIPSHVALASPGNEYYEKVEYSRLNPVRAGLVERAEDWPWSSVRDYAGNANGGASAHPVLPIDRILLPADERARI